VDNNSTKDGDEDEDEDGEDDEDEVSQHSRATHSKTNEGQEEEISGFQGEKDENKRKKEGKRLVFDLL
jgi:hypothetical protein